MVICTSTPSEFLREISREYSLPLLINPVKKGIGADWNFAYEKCDTQFLTLAHQDDVYSPDYSEIFLSAPGAADSLLMFSDYGSQGEWSPKWERVNGLVKKVLLTPFRLRNAISSRTVKRAVLALGNPIACPSVMFNKGLIPNFRFNEDYRFVLDWDAWIRLAGIPGVFNYIPQKLMYHRIHPDSETSRQMRDDNRAREESLIFDQLWPAPLARLIRSAYRLSAKANSPEEC